MTGNQRSISEITEFDVKKCKKQPFKGKMVKKKTKKRAQQGRMENIALKQKRNATEKKLRAMPFFLTQKRVPLNRICLLRNVKITLTILKNKGYVKIIVADKRKTDYR